MAAYYPIQAVALSTVFFVFALLFPATTIAQNCNPSDITLSNQVEVDNFQADHGPCDRVPGQLKINGDDITNLAGLQSLKTVVGNLVIEDNNVLTNIDGLSSLTVVTIDPVYKIVIQRNAALLNLDGLSALTELQGALIIHLNDSLADISGLANLSRIGALLHIAANPALASLEGLQSLTRAGGLGIVNNATLSDISSLFNLEAVQTWLDISFNPMLADCRALVTLIDPIDDFQPGPGTADIPDIGDTVKFQDNSKSCNGVNTILGEEPLMAINAGLNDAWFNPETDGQGFLIVAFPQIRQMFMAWFTYDTERPAADTPAILGEPGHRWLTAQGGYEDNVAGLDAYITSGGVFDSPYPIPVTEPDGEILLEFDTCNSGTLTYDIPSISRQGVVPIERTTLDNVALCYLLDKQ